MKQLGILDSAFINLEHPNTPQQIGGLGIYDPSTAPGGFVRFKGVIANFEQRLMKHPMFRSRLVRSPGNLDRPYWVQDANFDVEFHIRHIALPQPGDWRQLCILVSRIHARPLDMSRPLWEAYIIEGLDNIPDVPKGAFAIYTKMHHSLVDGAGGASFMSVIHDLEPDPKPADERRQTILVDAAPNSLFLAASSAVNQVRNTVQLARGAVGVARGLGRMALGIARKQVPLPAIRAPKTRFNRPVGPYRVFEAAEFPLDELKMIKNTAATKVNDVVLAIVSGAMRRYLDHLGELPEESLAAAIPLNMRTRRGVTDDNNQIGSVFMELHTDIEDPLDRLKAIQQSGVEAKQFGETSPLVDVMKLAGAFSPALTRPVVNLYINNHLSSHMPATVSTVVSNVAGPPFPLYSAGARMVRYYGIGLLTPGVGLFHLAFSSDGIMTLSAVADRDVMPDPGFYRECMYAAYEELREAALEQKARQERSTPSGGAGEPVKSTANRKSAGGGRKSATAGTGRRRASSRKQGADRAANPGKTGGKRPVPKAPVRKARSARGQPASETDRVESILPPSPSDADEPKAAGSSNVVSIGGKKQA